MHFPWTMSWRLYRTYSRFNTLNLQRANKDLRFPWLATLDLRTYFVNIEQSYKIVCINLWNDHTLTWYKMTPPSYCCVRHASLGIAVDTLCRPTDPGNEDRPKKRQHNITRAMLWSSGINAVVLLLSNCSRNKKGKTLIWMNKNKQNLTQSIYFISRPI